MELIMNPENINSIEPAVALVYLTEPSFFYNYRSTKFEVMPNSESVDDQKVTTEVNIKNKKLNINFNFRIIHRVAVKLDKTNHECSAKLFKAPTNQKFFSVELNENSDQIKNLGKEGTELFIEDNIVLPNNLHLEAFRQGVESALEKVRG